MSEYIMNKETGKLELHFDKTDYLKLPEENKSEIKSNFLFSRASGAWVSRCKFPNLYRAEQIAKKLGLENGGKVGETLTFEEQQQVKAEKAERRAERYEARADRAAEAGKQLQEPINRMHGDISFFTQPNINSSGGRAFTNRRNRMFASYERGFEEFKKSEYYQERAEVARQTADNTRPTDKGFIDRRIKDAEKTIKAQAANLKEYEKRLERLNNGEELKHWNGELVTVEEVENWIEKASDIMENAISKSIYYHECMEAVGGVAFAPENIKVGYTVDLARWGKCEVTSTGKVNIGYRILTGGAAGMGGSATYAEINSIVSTEIKPEELPFKVGDVYTVDVWDGNRYAPKEYTVIKVENGKVTIKSGNERAITKKPRRSMRSSKEYALGISDGRNGTVYKSLA